VLLTLSNRAVALRKGDRMRSSATARAGSAAPHVVSSALKVLDGLRILCDSDGPVSLGELRDKLGVSEPTAFRVAQTLIHAGYARPAVGVRHGYEPALEIARLAGRAMRREQVLDAARAVLGPIARRFEEPITVGVQDGDYVLFVEKLCGPRDPTFFCAIGERLPLHVGAVARCILAHVDDTRYEHYLAHSLKRLTAQSDHDHRVTCDRLRNDRQLIRHKGYTLSVEEVDVGISAVGVPILNGNGEILAGAAIANLTARWTAEDLRLRARMMVDAATQVMARVVEVPARNA